MMHSLLDITSGFLVLVVLEVVLGIDNLVFLTLLTGDLPAVQKRYAKRIGLTLAWMMRLLLLYAALHVMSLTKPILSLWSYVFSIRDLCLLIGGLFLITKATQEIHVDIALVRKEQVSLKKSPYFTLVILQIACMDLVFSLDSVLTAVGLTSMFYVMAAAITISILIMLFASDIVGHFINKYPTLKMLAMGFLILIGMILIADGFGYHLPREYVYFAMGFSLCVEVLNNLARKSN